MGFTTTKTAVVDRMRPFVIGRKRQASRNIALQARLKGVCAPVIEGPTVIDGGIAGIWPFSSHPGNAIQRRVGESMRNARSKIRYLKDCLLPDLLLNVH